MCKWDLGGVYGIDGVDGVDGIDGIDGVDGIDGIDGIDGVGRCWSVLVSVGQCWSVLCAFSRGKLYNSVDDNYNHPIAPKSELKQVLFRYALV